jgi:diguanylate cyclase (GGDEF)-like protein
LAAAVTGTILVADDSRTVRALLRHQLEGRGFRVAEAVDGADAVRVCREVRPDVVLMDVMMPALDGHGALQVLRADPEVCDIPVVFLTTRSSTDDVVEGLRLGAHDYLGKPFEPSELIARISAALRVKYLQDELRERNRELDRITRTDALTGLFNRRHLWERLTEMVSSGRRTGRPIGVLMLDLDHFKTINDSAGHAAGDAVLCAVADRLRAEVRLEDVVGRWGGEEFVVILDSASAVDAGLVAERLRLRIAAEPVAVEPAGEVPVTVSIGCAVGPEDGEELLHHADAALYRAKAGGRNRVAGP